MTACVSSRVADGVLKCVNNDTAYTQVKIHDGCLVGGPLERKEYSTKHEVTIVMLLWFHFCINISVRDNQYGSTAI